VDKTKFLTRQKMIYLFSLKRVNKPPASFDPKKLAAFQDRYMQALPVEKRVAMVMPYLQRAGLIPSPPDSGIASQVTQIVHAAGDRIKVAGDILDYAFFFLADDRLVYDEKSFDKRMRKPADGVALLSKFRDRLSQSEAFDAASLEQLARSFVQSEGVESGDIVHALRIAATGKPTGFGLWDTLAILGKERSVQRIDRALARV